MYTKDTIKVIEVKPIEIEKWHGKKGQESFARPKKLQALVDGATMQYATGLNDADIESLKKEGGVNYDLTPNFNSQEPHPFWDSNMATVKLENNTMFLHINQPLDYIKYSIMKASRFVANSRAELDAGLWPYATHVISDEKEEAEIVAKRQAVQDDAVIKARSLTLDRKIELILILGGKNVKGQSEAFVSVELRKVIDKDPEAFLQQADKEAEENATLAMVYEAIQKGIFRKEASGVYYFEESIGTDEIAASNYLSNDKNQDFMLLIKQKLEN